MGGEEGGDVAHLRLHKVMGLVAVRVGGGQFTVHFDRLSCEQL